MRQNIEDSELRRAVIKEGFKLDHLAITAGADITLDLNMPPMLIITATGANRKLIMPLASTAKGFCFTIFNTSATDLDIAIRDSTDSATYRTVYQNQCCTMYCDGTQWIDMEPITGAIQGAFAAGLFTTVGGDATESISVPGAVATDVPIVTVNTDGGTPRTVTKAICTTNAITVTLSGDPSTVHVLNYVVIRP